MRSPIQLAIKYSEVNSKTLINSVYVQFTIVMVTP